MLKELAAVTIVCLMLSERADAQYIMRLENDSLAANAGVYEFDVVVASTSGTINLTSYQLSFTYNTDIAGSGTLNFSYVGGTSALTNPPEVGVSIYLDGGANLGAGSDTGSDTITTTPVKVGTFRISSTQGFVDVSANVAWDFEGSLQTMVNVENAPVTNQSNHVNLLSNPPPSFGLRVRPPIVSQERVVLSWVTNWERDVFGWWVQRARADSAALYETIPNAFCGGQKMVTTIPHDYYYTDLAPTLPSYYRFMVWDMSGAVHFTKGFLAAIPSAIEEDMRQPTAIALWQNYPNPFNPSTTIRFAVPQRSHVTLTVFNTLGQQIATLVNGDIGAGYHSVQFDASNLAGGVYIYRLTAGDWVQAKKLVVLK